MDLISSSLGKGNSGSHKRKEQISSEPGPALFAKTWQWSGGLQCPCENSIELDFPLREIPTNEMHDAVDSSGIKLVKNINDLLSRELFYAGERGDVVKCKELIHQGADVNWKADSNLWYRTPLMQAAKEGQTEVCKLYAESNAEIDAFTVSHYTALILAARNGRTETCLFLLSVGANVNNQTTTGETALMWEAGHGHTDTCRCLIDRGAKLNLVDCYGITALIRAAKNGHAYTVITLLENGADVDLAAKLGNKTLDAQSWAQANNHRDVVGIIQTHKNCRSLLKDGADPPSYVPLCACGSVNAGKTTLLTKLQLNAIQRRFASVRDQPDTSEDMASRTCGIHIEVINVPGVGEFRKMDMAGHSWAFTSNEYFVGRRTSVSMVLFDLSKSDEEVRSDLVHHLGLLKAKETKRGFLRYRPEIILVATHADKFTNARVRANAFFKGMMVDFQAYLNFYPKVFVLDCRNPYSEEFEALRNCLKELREKIIKNSERVPRLCSVLLPHIRSWAKERPSFPVLSWKDFVQRVKEVNKVADDEGVKLIAFYLSESGEIVNDDSPELRDKVVLNVNWLTSHVFGIALAPANFPVSLRSDRVNGMVAKDELQSAFPECPLEQLIELFVRFEVCLPWDEQNLICRYYLFPSHLENGQRDLSDVWPKFDQGPVCAVGRIVECKNTTDTIPPSFFPKLQIRLLKRFGHKSPVWHGGLKIADDVVQILVTLSSNLRAVNLCVWAPKGCEERCYAALTFIESLRDRLFNEIAGGTELVHKALSITKLRDKELVGYLLEEVNRALDDGPNARVVLEECAINERALDVKYCGIRRFLYPREHISHLPRKRRKQLARLLDTGDDSIFKSLVDCSKETSSAVESQGSWSSGFIDVMSSSPTDRALSVWALERDHTGSELIEIFERMKRFDASTIINEWLSEVSMHHDKFDSHRMREESVSSEWNCSLQGKIWTSTGPSEHSELEGRARRTTSPFERSPPFQLSNKTRAVTVPMDLQREQTYGIASGWDRSYQESCSGQCGPSEHSDVTPDRELGFNRLRFSSKHSFPTEDSSSHCGSVGKLSFEETQRHSTTQMVPYPRVRIDFCSGCKSCQVKLSLQETEAPKVRSGTEETSHDSHHEGNKSADLDLGAVPVQVSHSDSKEERGEEVPLSKAETGGRSDLTVRTGFMTQLIPDLSSKLGLSWKPVALDLGFQSSDLETFEDTGLLRIQANQMLDAWLVENSCLLDCERCGEVLLERLQESLENAGRADLKDFLQHYMETKKTQ